MRIMFSRASRRLTSVATTVPGHYQLGTKREFREPLKAVTACSMEYDTALWNRSAPSRLVPYKVCSDLRKAFERALLQSFR